MCALRLGRMDERQQFFSAANRVATGDRFTQVADNAFESSLLGHFYNEDTDMTHSVASIAYGKIILNPATDVSSHGQFRGEFMLIDWLAGRNRDQSGTL